MSYRLQSNRALSGRPSIMPGGKVDQDHVEKKVITLGFSASNYSVIENDGKIVI